MNVADLRRAGGAVAWRASATVRVLPDFLVIGAQKAGTTSLYDHLCASDAVLAARKKEVRFFDRHWDRGPRWYRWSFPTRPAISGPGHPRRITGEATPDYLLHPLAPSRAASVVPECRLIVVLRDPVERAHSQYRMNLALGTEDRPFADAVDDELARLAERPETTPGAPLVWDDARNYHSYVERSRYHPQLVRWLEHFPRHQLHVTTLEALVARPAEETASLCEFLGIPRTGMPATLVTSNARTYDALPPGERRRLAALFEADQAATAALTGLDLG